MKGLLLKDFYMVKKYCRVYMFIVVIFLATALATDGSFFVTFYPVLMMGMIPVTLLAYDEQSKWVKYCGTLPYSKTQIVSAKYLIGLFFQITALLLCGIVQAVQMTRSGAFVLDTYLLKISLMLFAPCAISSVSLPFIFKLGVEKGRLVYIIMIGGMCAGFGVLATLMPAMVQSGIQAPLPSHGTPLVLCVTAIALYALSWYLSIVLYRKREV